MRIATHLTRLLALLGLPAGLICVGCASSDGESGENGTVRFSQVLDYGETSDFTAPIAAGRPIFLALQHPKEGFLDDETYAELTLRVEDAEGSEVKSVWPFGFAQYGVMFEDPGVYRLVAERDGVPADELSVLVQDLQRVELSQHVQVRTTYDDGDDTCTRFEEIDGLEGFTLHQNQRIELFLVPRNIEGTPMLGLLALTARAHDSIQLDAPLFGQGRRANALTLTPRGRLPDDILVKISDEDSGQTIQASFRGSNTDVVLDCND